MPDIVSPLPGVFYRSPGPGKAPYVEVGDRVEVGQTVGIVEIMKQFTEVQSVAAGVIDSFAVDDAGMVNPGDVLVVVAESQA